MNLENIFNIGYIRALSGFFTQSQLGPLLDWFRIRIEQYTASGMALRLFIWALVLIAIVVVVDHMIYLVQPENKDSFYKKIQSGKEFFQRIFTRRKVG